MYYFPQQLRTTSVCQFKKLQLRNGEPLTVQRRLQHHQEFNRKGVAPVWFHQQLVFHSCLIEAGEQVAAVLKPLLKTCLKMYRFLAYPAENK